MIMFKEDLKMIKMRNTKLSDNGFIEIIISAGIIAVVTVNYYGTDSSVYNWLTLHYVCGKKSVGSSACFGRDYEFNEAMAMLTQEAFSIFGLENAYIDFLKDLGFEVV